MMVCHSFVLFLAYLPFGFSIVLPKREAGFYTTRFGRSDPLMAMREMRTHYLPEPELNPVLAFDGEATAEPTDPSEDRLQAIQLLAKFRKASDSPWAKLGYIFNTDNQEREGLVPCVLHKRKNILLCSKPETWGQQLKGVHEMNS